MSFVESGLYLYALVRSKAAVETVHSQGVHPDQPIQFLSQGNLAAVVSSVPLGEFNPARLEQQLKVGEVRWLEEKVLAHATVLQELMQRGSVVPVRFGILFREPERLLSFLAAQEEEMVALLDRLAGKLEWGVKALCRDQEVKAALQREPEIMELQEHIKYLSTGKGYLYGKKLQLLLEEKAQERLALWAQRIHQGLERVSEAAEMLETNRDEERVREERMVLHGAYLVGQEKTAQFQEELGVIGKDVSGESLRFDLSGPWPPYHFARLCLEGEHRL